MVELAGPKRQDYYPRSLARQLFSNRQSALQMKTLVSADHFYKFAKNPTCCRGGPSNLIRSVTLMFNPSLTKLSGRRIFRLLANKYWVLELFTLSLRKDSIMKIFAITVASEKRLATKIVLNSNLK